MSDPTNNTSNPVINSVLEQHLSLSEFRQALSSLDNAMKELQEARPKVEESLVDKPDLATVVIQELTRRFTAFQELKNMYSSISNESTPLVSRKFESPPLGVDNVVFSVARLQLTLLCFFVCFFSRLFCRAVLLRPLSTPRVLPLSRTRPMQLRALKYL